jgi:Tfp pilus assembly protein PilO
MTDPLADAAGRAADLNDVLLRFLDVVGAAGWPAVVALVVVLGGVLVAAILAAPRLGSAISALRGGASERERELERKVVELDGEVGALRQQLEEQARVFSLLLEHLPDVQGVDREALARIFTPPPPRAASSV